MIGQTRVDWNEDYIGANEPEDMEEKARQAEAEADAWIPDESADSEEETSVGQLNGPMFDFDDLEVGMAVYHRGEKGWIVGHGEDVIGNLDSRHIEVAFEADQKNRRIHENTVNRYLKNGTNLWVDFHGLTETEGQ